MGGKEDDKGDTKNLNGPNGKNVHFPIDIIVTINALYHYAKEIAPSYEEYTRFQFDNVLCIFKCFFAKLLPVIT